MAANTVPKVSLSSSLTQLAFTQLKLWAARSDSDEKAKLHAALREFPLLVRRHGLARVVTFWLEENPADCAHAEVASAFLDAIHKMHKFAVVEDIHHQAKAKALCAEPLRSYLLHSHLALALADEWLALSEAMLLSETPATVRAANEDTA
jgi:hypothetical protein